MRLKFSLIILVVTVVTLLGTTLLAQDASSIPLDLLSTYP